MSDDNDQDGADDTISPEERIKELNEIDRAISQLPMLASRAIGLLPNEDSGTLNPKVEDVKEQFESYAREYYTTLSAVSVRLKRQVYALEEADLITKGTKFDADRATNMNENQTSRREGLGSLDSSWLNARAKDTAGEGLKQEILAEAKAFLQRSGIDVRTKTDNDTQMDTGD